MTRPKRITLKRTKGYRKPEGAVVVTRQSKHYGNPFRVGTVVTYSYGGRTVSVAINQQLAFDLYAKWLAQQDTLVALIRAELAGRDLACYCKPGDPCHADVLLMVANPGRTMHRGEGGFVLGPSQYPPSVRPPGLPPGGAAGAAGVAVNVLGAAQVSDAALLAVVARNEADRRAMLGRMNARGR